MYISRFSLQDKVTLWLLKLHFVGVDVVEWSRALEIRLSDWCCSVSNVWAQISSKEEQSLTAQKSNSNTIPKNSTHGEQHPWRNGAKYSEIGTKSDNFTVNNLYNNPWQMTYWLFEIVLINLCNKYCLFKLKYVWCICVYSNRSIQIMLEYFCYRFLSCTCSVWVVKKHWLVKCLFSTVTDQDIVDLVPDSYWAAIINSNSTRADFTEDTVKTIRTTLVSALFRQFNSCFVYFLTLLN
jgi:hypothetical protein